MKSVQPGSSRCAGCVTIAESPRRQGRTLSTEARWSPHESSPPNGHHTVGERAPTERLGVPLRGAPSCC
eukprot:12592887-Alexandrium_andersonii.AAC.1